MALLVKIEKVNQLAKTPTKATEGSAAYDLYAATSGVIATGQVTIIPCGFKMAFTDKYVALVCSRSGMAAKKAVFALNAPGVVDSDYRGEVGVVLCNTGPEAYNYQAGDRIAQLLFVPKTDVSFTETKLEETERSSGGFGSSGA